MARSNQSARDVKSAAKRKRSSARKSSSASASIKTDNISRQKSKKISERPPTPYRRRSALKSSGRYSDASNRSARCQPTMRAFQTSTVTFQDAKDDKQDFSQLSKSQGSGAMDFGSYGLPFGWKSRSFFGRSGPAPMAPRRSIYKPPPKPTLTGPLNFATIQTQGVFPPPASAFKLPSYRKVTSCFDFVPHAQATGALERATSNLSKTLLPPEYSTIVPHIPPGLQRGSSAHKAEPTKSSSLEHLPGLVESSQSGNMEEILKAFQLHAQSIQDQQAQQHAELMQKLTDLGAGINKSTQDQVTAEAEKMATKMIEAEMDGYFQLLGKTIQDKGTELLGQLNMAHESAMKTVAQAGETFKAVVQVSESTFVEQVLPSLDGQAVAMTCKRVLDKDPIVSSSTLPTPALLSDKEGGKKPAISSQGDHAMDKSKPVKRITVSSKIKKATPHPSQSSTPSSKNVHKYKPHPKNHNPAALGPKRHKKILTDQDCGFPPF